MAQLDLEPVEEEKPQLDLEPVEQPSSGYVGRGEFAPEAGAESAPIVTQQAQDPLAQVARGVFGAIGSMVPKSLSDVMQMITLPRPSEFESKDLPVSEQLGEAWRGEHGLEEQAKAITGTALQAAPLIHLPFAESPLRPTPKDLSLVNAFRNLTREPESLVPLSDAAENVATKEIENASKITGAEGIPSTEIRPSVDEETSLRQQGETAGILPIKEGESVAPPSGIEGRAPAVPADVGQVSDGLEALADTGSKPVASDARPDWMKQNDVNLNAIAEKSGVADKIEELHAQRFTAGEIADQLGIDKSMVRAVRAERGLPQRTDAMTVPMGAGGVGGATAPENPEFTKWVTERASTGAPPVAPKLLPGETQGDLISSTQQEPLQLVGENGVDYGAIQKAEETTKAARAESDKGQTTFEDLGAQLTKEDEARLKDEYEKGILSDLEEHQQRGGDELLDAVKSLGGLRIDEPHFGDLKEAFQKKAGFSKLASGEEGYRYKDIFQKNAPGGDALVQALRAKGFDVENPGHLADMLDTRFKTGKKVYGVEARAQEGGISGLEGYALGAAGKGEIPEPRVTGMKNRIVDEERVKRGLEPIMAPARKAMGKTWDDAMQQVEDGESRGEAVGYKMVDDILSRSKKQISETDQAVLLHERIRIQNERDMAAERVNDSNTSPEDRVEAQNNWAAAEDRLNETEVALHEAGTISGRALQIRQMMVRDDYTFAGMERRARAAKGGTPLTPEESTKIQELSARITDLEKQLEARQGAHQETEKQEAFDTELTALKKRARGERGEREALSPDEQQQKLTQALSERALEGDAPEDVGHLVHQLALNFVREGITEREPLIDAVHGVVGPMFDIARHITRDLISGYGKFKALDPEVAKAQLRQLKGEMQQVSKIEDMAGGQAPRKTGIERRTPSDEERRLIRQVNEMKKKGGFEITDPARQLKSALDTIKTRLTNQIRDLHTALATRTPIEVKKGGVPYDAEALRLKGMRDQLKAHYDEIFKKPGLTDEQRLNLAKGAAERSVKDWEQRLSDAKQGKFTRPDGKKLTSPEIDAIRAQREALKAEVKTLQDLSPEFQKTKEQVALSLYKQRITQRIADLEGKISRGDFTRQVKKPPTPLDREALQLQAKSEKVKSEFEEGILRKKLEDRPDYEKALDTLLKYRRGFVLSWPTIFAKLTSAAFLRLVSEPIEAGIGAGLRRLPGAKQVFERAPIEGQTNVGTIARSTAKAFTVGMKDAWETLRTGKSDLDRVFGKKNYMPHEWIDYFGTMHAVLKAPIKRLGFEMAMENQMAHGLRNGVDITDPIIQTQMGLRAYAHGERLIFQQDNRITSAFNQAMRRLEQPTKETGHATVGGKLAATAARAPLPVMKVPTNVVSEVFNYTLGSFAGGTRLAAALKRGVATLSEAEADSIARQLKKGSLGAALLATGYLLRDKIGGYHQPNEKRPKDQPQAGEMMIAGYRFPRSLFHAAIAGPLQVGATIGRVMDTQVKGVPKGIGEGIIEGLIGPITEVPFYTAPKEILHTFEAPNKTTAAGQIIGNAVTPGAVQYAARVTDKMPEGDVTKRKPQSFWQGLEAGIPYMRRNVPEKAQPASGVKVRP